jgi:hypothetical protein
MTGTSASRSHRRGWRGVSRAIPHRVPKALSGALALNFPRGDPPPGTKRAGALPPLSGLRL